MGRLPGNEAVSPIIGVVLLVGIAVTLSASIWLFTDRLVENSSEEAAPAVGFRNDAGGRLLVVRAPEGAAQLDWMDLEFDGSCEPLLNGAAMPMARGTIVTAGDVITCDLGEELTVTSSQDRGGSVLFQTDF